MKIGIIGVGVVGGTLAYGFNRIGHEVIKHDLKLATKIDVVLGTLLTFVCVPTLQAVNGLCDTSSVEEVVASLAEIGYEGVVVIKSTVTPGTTDRLAKEFPFLRLAFCPEFLREKSTYSDFVENHDVCIIGTLYDKDFELVKAAHEPLPKAYELLTPIEAELAKYFSNTFNAARIIFANQFFEVCKAVGANYTAVKNAVSKRTNIGGYYLDCNENFRAFGGSCLPKDTSALATFVKEKGIDAPMFEWLLAANERIKSK